MGRNERKTSNFYPRPPRGGRLFRGIVRGGRWLISIHALREEGDRRNMDDPRRVDHISIHALREEGDQHKLSTGNGRHISIHALREEGDKGGHTENTGPSDFYPRPPRGGRPCLPGKNTFTFQFLSTPSARRATPTAWWPLLPGTHFYPRPPRGGRLCNAWSHGVAIGISIHALREEGDAAASFGCSPSLNFYPRPPRGGRPASWSRAQRKPQFLSTPSARRATEWGLTFDAINEFLSTPSARRATGIFPPAHSLSGNFYPRPPRGGRRKVLRDADRESTISIHALREEGDQIERDLRILIKNFYPRPPRGGRPDLQEVIRALVKFLSTPSARRATCSCRPQCTCWCYFYPRPPRGGRHLPYGNRHTNCHFYPRPPRGGRRLPA